MPETAPSLAAAVGLAIVHLVAGKMRFLAGIPRNRWLSAAGGVSVAYVFLHLLPELARAQEEFRASGGPLLEFTERHVYLIAMSGLAIFYGLEKLALESRRGQRAGEREDETSAGVFWLHIASFGLYNVLIGYLLLNGESRTLASLATYFVAMALHFVVNDFALWEHHKDRYRRAGRWLISGAVLTGWAVGAATAVHPIGVSVLMAFLSGGIVLNVLKEEIPGERQSRFWAFALGLGAYAVLLLSM